MVRPIRLQRSNACRAHEKALTNRLKRLCIATGRVTLAGVNRILKTIVLSAALGALAAASAPAAPAPPATDYQLLRRIPPDVIERLTKADFPDASGATEFNRPQWRNVVYQRRATRLLWAAAVENDAAKERTAWTAIDLALKHQLPDGSYDASAPMSPNDMSFWLWSLGQALVVLQESPLGPSYAGRIHDLLPVLRRNAQWLMQPARIAALDRKDQGAVNRLISDADAFGIMSRLLGGDAQMQALAEHFAREAQSKQQPDGNLPEHGGFDSSYLAASLLTGSYYVLDVGKPAIQPMLAAALSRELRAIGPDGKVDVSENTRTGRGQEFVFGHPKGVEKYSIVLGLYYTGYLLGNQQALDAARRVFDSPANG
jgi:hypothetical protein